MSVSNQLQSPRLSNMPSLPVIDQKKELSEQAQTLSQHIIKSFKSDPSKEKVNLNQKGIKNENLKNPNQKSCVLKLAAVGICVLKVASVGSKVLFFPLKSAQNVFSAVASEKKMMAAAAMSLALVGMNSITPNGSSKIVNGNTVTEDPTIFQSSMHYTKLAIGASGLIKLAESSILGIWDAAKDIYYLDAGEYVKQSLPFISKLNLQKPKQE